MTRKPQSQSFHVHDVEEHEQERAKSRCEVPRRKMAGTVNEE